MSDLMDNSPGGETLPPNNQDNNKPPQEETAPLPSSPSYKRLRREDGGFDRDGADKRFGYEDDHHQRGTGERLQNSEAARGGGRSKSGSDTNLKSSTEGMMMSYKQFTLQLEDDIQPSEAWRRYKEHTTEYISTQKKVFFELHKEEEWLKEKYYPKNLLHRYVRKIGDEKFRCRAEGCIKLFSAPKYVLKHLELKHPDLVMELTTKKSEDLYFANYMNDPNGPVSIPVIQKTIGPSRPLHSSSS